MALRDHSLDDKIVAAAKAEFLAHGFRGASLHKIADRAGITTGALYTRYKNKDALFCSLVEQAFARIATEFEPMARRYRQVQTSGDPAAILEVIKQEEKIYLDLLFEYYDECILFFCRSDGSSVQTMLDTMMAEKVRQTVEFLQSMAKTELNPDGIELIMLEQFRYYRLILEKGYTKERAVACMETVELFLEAGFKALFEKVLT